MRNISFLMSKMIFAAVFLISLLGALEIGTGTVFGDSAEEMYSVVAYLHSEKEIPRTVEIGDESYQVWLKHPKEGQPRPYFETRYGTGFFVVRGDSLFLVTAQHVANEMNMSSTVTIKSKEDKPLRLSLQELWNRPEPTNWTFHKEADIAVLVLNPPKPVLQRLSGHFLPFEMIASEEKAPLRERRLTIIGFPLGLGIGNEFSPISQESKSASGLLTFFRFDNHQATTFYILDRPSVGGFSGAPVFMLPGPYFSNDGVITASGIPCVGLVHGTLLDSTGGKFAAVVPSPFIVQTIQQAEESFPVSDRNWVIKGEQNHFSFAKFPFENEKQDMKILLQSIPTLSSWRKMMDTKE